MFRYTQPTSKAQTFAIAQAFMVYLLKTHSLLNNAPQPRAALVQPRPSWPARAGRRHLPTINEPAIILATLIFVGIGALLHGAASL